MGSGRQGRGPGQRKAWRDPWEGEGTRVGASCSRGLGRPWRLLPSVPSPRWPGCFLQTPSQCCPPSPLVSQSQGSMTTHLKASVSSTSFCGLRENCVLGIAGEIEQWLREGQDHYRPCKAPIKITIWGWIPEVPYRPKEVTSPSQLGSGHLSVYLQPKEMPSCHQIQPSGNQ